MPAWKHFNVASIHENVPRAQVLVQVRSGNLVDLAQEGTQPMQTSTISDLLQYSW